MASKSPDISDSFRLNFRTLEAVFLLVGWTAVCIVASRYLLLEKFGIFAVVCALEMVLIEFSGLLKRTDRTESVQSSINTVMRFAFPSAVCVVQILYAPDIVRLLFGGKADPAVVPLYEAALWFGASSFGRILESELERGGFPGLVALSGSLRVLSLATAVSFILPFTEVPFPRSVELSFLIGAFSECMIGVAGCLYLIMRKAGSESGSAGPGIHLRPWTVLLPFIFVGRVDPVILGRHSACEDIGLYVPVVFCVLAAWSAASGISGLLCSRLAAQISPGTVSVDRNFIPPRISGVLLTVILFCFAEEILVLLFGPPFAVSARYLRIASLSLPFLTCMQTHGKMTAIAGTHMGVELRTPGALAIYLLLVSGGAVVRGVPGAAVAMVFGCMAMDLVMRTEGIHEGVSAFFRNVQILLLAAGSAFIIFGSAVPVSWYVGMSAAKALLCLVLAACLLRWAGVRLFVR